MVDPFRRRRRPGDGDGDVTLNASTTGLSEERLAAALGRSSFVTRLVVRRTVASTNDALRELATEGASEGTVVVAEGQTAGRGRLSRVWESPAGLGLYLSVLVRPSGALEEIGRWTLAASVAACAACRSTTGGAVEIKWPNDIVWGGRKLGGVLAELRSIGGCARDLVLGLGLNVFHRRGDFPEPLADSATSLRLIASDVRVDREGLAASYLEEFAVQAQRLHAGDWPRVASAWEGLSPGARGMHVRVHEHPTTAVPFEGMTDGLGRDGSLRVRSDDGEVRAVRMADAVTRVED